MDAFVGGWAEGQAGYGGLIAEATTGASTGVFPIGRSEYFQLPGRFVRSDAFNRQTIQVAPGKIRYLINDHLLYEDNDPSPTSPWLTLFCSAARQTSFRSLTLSGSPVIPREVALTHGDRLEGWVSSFLGQSQLPRMTLAPEDPKREALTSDSAIDEYDWVAREGVVQCRRTEPLAANHAVQSRLYYHRPLRSGDAVTYEFLYEPGAVMAHPTLDRIAFILEPDGVRLHYITDGPDQEWTGLSTDNLADEPKDRQGAGPLPLKAKAWNAARVALEGDTAILTLNEVEIYRRALEPDNSRQFGFFHFRDRTAAQFRNAVLTGDWPRELPAKILANLSARGEHGVTQNAQSVEKTGDPSSSGATLPK